MAKKNGRAIIVFQGNQAEERNRKKEERKKKRFRERERTIEKICVAHNKLINDIFKPYGHVP